MLVPQYDFYLYDEGRTIRCSCELLRQRTDEKVRILHQKMEDDILEDIASIEASAEAEWLPQDILHYTPTSSAEVKHDDEDNFWEELDKYELLPY